MKKFIFIIIFLMLSLLFIVFFIVDNINKINPVDLSNKYICANDGMTIVDYKGPKAQIIWNDNIKSFYCEVREAFYEWVNPLKRKNIRFFYVQDFSYMKWGSYVNNWVNAKDVFYVIDSEKYGAMGISYVPFLDIVYANLFVKKYGGIIVEFDDITLDVLEKSNEIIKDRMIEICVN